MKKILLATVVALASTSVFAEPTAVIKVKGTLTNSSCSPEIGNGGVIDYGYIHLAELSATDTNQLETKQVPVTITCTAPTKVGFRMMDDRASTNAGLSIKVNSTTLNQSYMTYGIGQTSEGVKIGNYSLWMSDITADGAAADTIYHYDDWPENSWTYAKALNPRSDYYSISTVAKTGTLEPMAFQTFTFNFNSNLAIRDTTTLAITDDTALDGQATMTLVYL